jgi:hypothetical protein
VKSGPHGFTHITRLSFLLGGAGRNININARLDLYRASDAGERPAGFSL